GAPPPPARRHELAGRRGDPSGPDGPPEVARLARDDVLRVRRAPDDDLPDDLLRLAHRLEACLELRVPLEVAHVPATDTGTAHDRMNSWTGSGQPSRLMVPSLAVAMDDTSTASGYLVRNAASTLVANRTGSGRFVSVYPHVEVLLNTRSFGIEDSRPCHFGLSLFVSNQSEKLRYAGPCCRSLKLRSGMPVNTPVCWRSGLSQYDWSWVIVAPAHVT